MRLRGHTTAPRTARAPLRGPFASCPPAIRGTPPGGPDAPQDQRSLNVLADRPRERGVKFGMLLSEESFVELRDRMGPKADKADQPFRGPGSDSQLVVE